MKPVQPIHHMLSEIHPKLPMRDKSATRHFYIDQMGFTEFGQADYPGYLMVEKDQIQIHFFEHLSLDPLENDGQVYIRTTAIHDLYQYFSDRQVPCQAPEHKPWGQIEFSVLDPDHNLLTFGQGI